MENGDIEMDPGSLPPGLAGENFILTDEMASYNYKTNYEQQVIINQQKARIEALEERIKRLEKLLPD